MQKSKNCLPFLKLILMGGVKYPVEPPGQLEVSVENLKIVVDNCVKCKELLKFNMMTGRL